MQQFALEDLGIDPGRVLRWRLTAPWAESGPDEAQQHRSASFNQERHFTTIEDSRREGEAFGSWLGLTFELDGELDRAALESALLLLAHRHEVLRCEFSRLLGDLSVDTFPAEEVRLQAEDVGEFATSRAMLAYFSETFRRETDAMNWPLYTMGAIVREGGSTTVCLAFDHIVADGISMMNVVHDIQLAYDAYRSGKEPELPEAGSYTAFAHEQRRRYASIDKDDARLDGWRRFAEETGDFFPRFPLDLGVESGRMYPTIHEGRTLLDADGAAALDLRCRAAGGKLFMGLLAGVGAAVRDLGGPETYRALMPVSERGAGAQRNALGWYVNTLPIAFSVAAWPSAPLAPDLAALTRTLADVREGFSTSLEFADVPFVRAWELLAPHHFACRSWPFPVNFFSYIDTRKGPGSEHHPRWRPVLHVWCSETNGTNSWFVRDADGLHLDSIYADTPQARATMANLQQALAGTLRTMADVRVPDEE